MLLLDEPTRGIDVGAKSEIFQIMIRRLAGEGYGVLFVSSELKEVLAMSDRILVMSKGDDHRRIRTGARHGSAARRGLGRRHDRPADTTVGSAV